MTQKEFNEKYKQYIPEGWGGLEFDIPEVTDFINSIMEDGLTNLPGFELHQIKLKFGMCRFYFGTAMKSKRLEAIIEVGIETRIDLIIKNLKDENI